MNSIGRPGQSTAIRQPARRYEIAEPDTIARVSNEVIISGAARSMDRVVSAAHGHSALRASLVQELA